ncbi:hypothetical protein HY333_01240 [Candidatus Collierbacteria bacterium]|nr:hypothetical protein [Candidatus Collierbacteria bacterium]
MDDAKDNLPGWWLTVFGYCLLGSAVLLIALSWQRLPPEVPWLYSLPWGERQLINKWWYGGSLLVGGVIFGVNSLIAQRIGKVDLVAEKVMLVASLIILILYLFGFIKTFSLMV